MINSVRDIRPASRFETYRAVTESQQQALDLCRAFAEEVAGADARERMPFPSASLLSITGPPGVGKSHLLEAIVAHVAEVNPGMAGRILLHRRQPGGSTIPGSSYGFPVVLIDDAFSSLDDAGMIVYGLDGEDLIRQLLDAYDKRVWVVINSNFSFVEHLPRLLAAKDKQGRAASRIKEIGGGVIHVAGPDARGNQAPPAWVRKTKRIA